MTNTGLDPRDLEAIAAFIDRRLPAEERRAFMKRLDREEALYEVFVETLRSRDQQSGRPATVIVHPRSRARWLAPATVAAVLALAAATALLVRALGEERYAETLVADGRFDPPPGAAWHQQGWASYRGIAPDLPEADAAFRAGVLGLDLEVALRLGRREDAAGLTAQLERTLTGIDFSEPLQVAYGQLRESLDPAAAGADLLARAAAAEADFAELFPELGAAYRLGRWAEAGKLAARSGNRQLLGGRGFARTGEALVAGEWGVEVAARLAAIGALLEAPSGELDLAALEDAFAAIINES